MLRLRLLSLTILAVLTLGTTTAAADTLSVQVSPSSTVGTEQVQLTMSAGSTYEVWWGLGNEASCPSDREAMSENRLYASGEAASLPYVTSFRAPSEHGVYRLCAYPEVGPGGGGGGGNWPVPVGISLTVTASPEEAGQAVAEERAHKTPVTHLSVRLETLHRFPKRHPGETLLYVAVTAYAHVMIELTHDGHHRTVRYDEVGTARGAPGPTVIDWSCSSPGGQYSYVVTARSNVGPTLVRRGHFANVSATQCHTLHSWLR